MVAKWQTVQVIVFVCILSISNTSFSEELRPWLNLPDSSVAVIPGSALDFTGIFNNTLDSSRRVVVNKDGRLSLEGSVNGAERFLCAPLLFPKPQGLFPTKPKIKRLAEQMKMQGYNLANIRFVDGVLMDGAERDFEFNPVQLDRFHYLLYQLKLNGIYWMLDVATSWNGAYAFQDGHRYLKRYSLDLDVHFKTEAQAHWRKMVVSILGRVNPYTQKPILLDPNLAVLTLFNEGGLAFQTRKKIPTFLKLEYKAWLKKKSEEHTFRLGGGFSDFLTYVEKRTLDWMTAYLRSMKYQGIITAYNNGKKVQSLQVRHHLDLISVHGYHSHPSNFVRQGSKIKNTSILEDKLPLVQYLTSVRVLGKPFIVDEYDQPYWSKWRREIGVILPAYAAFQGWDAICRFSNPVILDYSMDNPKRQKAIYPFGVGMDPVSQAGETLAALLYRRGDVQEGLDEVVLNFDRGTIRSKWKKLLPTEASRVGLYKKSGIRLTDRKEVGNKFELDGFTYKSGVDRFLEGGEGRHLELSLTGKLDSELELKKNHYDIFTNTGQVKVSSERKEALIITPLTEVAVIGDGVSRSMDLSALSVLSSSSEVVFSVSSLDGNSIEKSHRLLITFVTNARNTGDKYSTDGRELIKHGTLPIQIQDGAIKVKLKSDFASQMDLFALSINGSRKERIPVNVGSGFLFFDLVLGSLKTGPTVYFELVKKVD